MNLHIPADDPRFQTQIAKDRIAELNALYERINQGESPFKLMGEVAAAHAQIAHIIPADRLQKRAQELKDLAREADLIEDRRRNRRLRR